ncbi:Histone-lysine N-methyltransferase MLL4 [Cricetulus griseus]|uniref:Histone-lysine N-methyltransferase MLL4 n=1 Tax=Cricetulus griseus TaxID=10029 RepID=G3HPS9_CRIGR|nr:Histone-lysine N-methyltransferase MLL4 [Cricetulus griseus]
MRMARGWHCRGCFRVQDCGSCVNCLDKPKFGGPNTKKQCCVYRKCDKIEARKMERLAKKGRTIVKTLLPWDSDESPEASPGPPGPRRGAGAGGPREEVGANPCTEEQDSLLLQRKSARRCVKQRPSYDVFEDSDDSEPGGPPAPRRRTPREHELPVLEPEEQSRPRKPTLQPVLQLKARRRLDKVSTARSENPKPCDALASGPFASFPNGWTGKQKSPDGVHRVRVDFKEDCDLENVWLMGGLSVLTSVPGGPPMVCLLCASKGLHELVFCQVCCDPFHPFCLEEAERPLPQHRDTWCCRRCKFCHICSACVRCKSCGATPGKNWDVEWSGDYSLCPRCTELYEKAFQSKDPAAFSHLDDPRQCALCLKYGDADSKRCELCLKPGATVGCCLSSCLSNFHFMCARASYCIFQDDKKVFCQKHTDLLDGKSEPPNHDNLPDADPLIPGDPGHHSPVQSLDPPLRTDPSSGPLPTPRSFSGARIKVPNYSPSRRPLGGVSFGPLPSPGERTGEGSWAFCASCRVSRVRMKTPTVRGVLDLNNTGEPAGEESPGPLQDPGSLLPLPEGPARALDGPSDLLFESQWHHYSAGEASSSEEEPPSPEDKENQVPKRAGPHLRFEISSDDGFSVEAESLEGAWRTLIEKVQEARGHARLRHLSFSGMSGARLLGIHHDAVIFLAEQLPGAQRCQHYKFRYHQQGEGQEEPPLNPHGAARAEVYLRKCTFDMFNFLASQHRVLPEGAACDEEEDEVQFWSTR